MAIITGTYNPNAASYAPLPDGQYALEIVESDYLPNSNGTGMVLKCKAQIVGGEYDARPFYINYTLEHADEAAQEIGQREFAALRRATGVLAPKDTSDLHWTPFDVCIGIQPHHETGDPENYIRDYVYTRNEPAELRRAA